MSLDDIIVTPLRRIHLLAGDVLHGMKVIDPGFVDFGEAYFSIINKGEVKGWKRHNRMTLNFVVPAGLIKIAIVDDVADRARSLLVGPDDDTTYLRLTIPPGLWVAFGGMGDGLNLLFNLASHTHDPTEADNRPLTKFPWSW